MQYRSRNHQFDLLRIVFATLVLLSHAFAFHHGTYSQEFLRRATRGAMDFGALGVDGFFLLSGFLIVQSWDRYPHLGDFLAKRLLRIVPGYVVAVAVSTVIVGSVAAADPDFFQEISHGETGRQFWMSVGLLGSPVTPPVFPGAQYHILNGSLWTIPYEVRCYLVVALFGVLALRWRRRAWLGMTIVLLTMSSSYYLESSVGWTRLRILLGEPAPVYRLGAAFFVGGCFYLFRERIPLRPRYALAGLSIPALLAQLRPGQFEPALVLFGGYALFQWASEPRPGLAWMRRCPDISYGIYVYGWPVESLWIWWRHGSVWTTFFVSTLICFALGWASWHFVERPALKLKRHATAQLPMDWTIRTSLSRHNV